MTLATGPHAETRPVALIAAILTGVVAALMLRVVSAASDVPPYPAGLLFAAALLVVAVCAGWRARRPAPRGIVIGLAGAAVLVSFSAARGPAPVFTHILTPALALWYLVIIPIAMTEEIVLRGVLFDAVTRRFGDLAAVAVAAVAFAAIHLPLYGPSAMPLDLAVGVLLGGLRLSGGLAAAATAHTAADLLTGALL